MSRKPALATSAMIRKGGQQTELLPQPQTIRDKIRAKAHEKVGTIALTLRIDTKRYEQFTRKVAADGTNKQTVLSALLDDYLAS